jgi:hypothetical protein
MKIIFATHLNGEHDDAKSVDSKVVWHPQLEYVKVTATIKQRITVKLHH